MNYDDKNGKPYERFFNHSDLDKRIRPMERVIDIEGSEGYKIYPFSALAKKNVINDHYDNRDIVIFYKKGTISVLDKRELSESKSIGSATLFSPLIDGSPLTFKSKSGQFIDNETNSTWDITGLCINGKLKGKKLTPGRFSNHFAFAWLSFHPESEIYGEKKRN